jgi:hypothetical protein
MWMISHRQCSSIKIIRFSGKKCDLQEVRDNWVQNWAPTIFSCATWNNLFFFLRVYFMAFKMNQIFSFQ